MDFEKWIDDVARNGVKTGSLTKDWAAMQVANHYSRGKITETALQQFDNEIAEYEAKQERIAEEATNDTIEEIGTPEEEESADAQSHYD